ncbi:MAG: hypothetical protein FJ207_01540 [Gemmatimonadetes bacterium]|nr:hypothetical protein [Gemmatimonadota bacterium]
MLAALALAWTSACANQGAPPGGPVDRRPPVLVRTEPDTFATLTDMNANVRFFFDERISENVSAGQLDDAVTVSPRTGRVRVRHGRTSLSVEVEGGFRSGIVYRVTLLPMVRDMFGNELRDPFELVFSTGGEAPPTALAGQVWSRTNGGATRGALVQAVSADSLVYLARSDQAGIYTFRYLPEGEYTITAFEDVDRDGTLDAREPQGFASSALASGDTLLVDVATLPYDTTAAVAMGATALDSVTIALEFDDYLDVDVPAAGVVVALERDSASAPRVVRLFHEREYAAYVDQVADSLARLDSIDAAAAAALAPVAPPAPDSTGAVDQAAQPRAAPPAPVSGAGGVAGGVDAAPRSGTSPRPPSRPVPPRLQGGPSTTPNVTRPLPTRRLVGMLDALLEAEADYRVQASGVVNINGVAGGGGEVELVLRLREAAPAPAGPGGAPGGDAGGAPNAAAGGAPNGAIGGAPNAAAGGAPNGAAGGAPGAAAGGGPTGGAGGLTPDTLGIGR